MFEDIIAQLDELGVAYEEDTETGTLTINIADVDKMALIDIINVLNNSGSVFDIDQDAITVQGGEVSEDVNVDENADYMDEALAQMGSGEGGY